MEPKSDGDGVWPILIIYRPGGVCLPEAIAPRDDPLKGLRIFCRRVIHAVIEEDEVIDKGFPRELPKHGFILWGLPGRFNDIISSIGGEFFQIFPVSRPRGKDFNAERCAHHDGHPYSDSEANYIYGRQ